MTINIDNEHLLSLRDAAIAFPGRPHVSTIYRLALRGARGIRLETIMAGGRRFTSREAISRFVARTTAAHDRTGSMQGSEPECRNQVTRRGLDESRIA